MKNNIYIGVIFLLMALSNSVLAEDANGLEARVSLLEEEVGELQSEVVGPELEDRIAALEDTQDEMENWSVFPMNYRVTYNSEGIYLGRIVKDYPDSELTFIEYNFNNEIGYITIINASRYWATMKAAAVVYIDSACTQFGVTTYDYDDFYYLRIDNKINYPTSFSDLDNVRSMYVHKIDFDSIFVSDVYYERFDSRTGELSCRIGQQDTELYTVVDTEYVGNSMSPSVSYVDELPEEDVPHY